MSPKSGAQILKAMLADTTSPYSKSIIGLRPLNAGGSNMNGSMLPPPVKISFPLPPLTTLFLLSQIKVSLPAPSKTMPPKPVFETTASGFTAKYAN